MTTKELLAKAERAVQLEKDIELLEAPINPDRVAYKDWNTNGDLYPTALLRQVFIQGRDVALRKYKLELDEILNGNQESSQ